MSRETFLAPILDELAAFEVRLRDAVHQLVGELLRVELARRHAAGELAPRSPRGNADASDDADRVRGHEAAASMGRALGEEVLRDDALRAASGSPTRTAGGPPRRGEWTREQVVEQLSSWLMGGNPVEAAFLVRQGHRKLVTQAKKHFGRFEAALNAANLHLANKFPEGIPGKKRPPLVA